MKIKSVTIKISLFICFAFAIQIAKAQETLPHNSLTQTEVKAGWMLLFDGKTTNGWHLYNEGKIKSAWAVKNGELICDPNTEKVERGDLVSDQIFTNYDFSFEWKISEAGNSGVIVIKLKK